ncbi:MAG: hypothetical protein CL675_10825 [Bdellovibrionaceae bacterium]|nr:hypothetical protein [Pseudobdellovibrionaceae bacterium]
MLNQVNMLKVNLRSFIVFVLLSFGLPLEAAKIINKNPLKATAELRETIEASSFELHVSMELAELHHAYLERFQITPVQTDIVEFSDFQVEPVVRFYDKISKKKKEGISSGKSKLLAFATIQTDRVIDHKIQFNLTYQACTDEYCLLPKDLLVTAKLPESLVISKTQAHTDGLDLSAESFHRLMGQGDLLMVFLLVFLAGILTSLTPCVFPMIPITLAILGAKNHGRSTVQSFTISLAYVVGIATTYSTLGMIVASTGTLFGAFLGHPLAIAAISGIFLLMGLSMLGLFEIQVPLSLQTKLQSKRFGQNHLGAYGAGLFAGVVASPCIGPVLVAILAYVGKSQDVALGFLLLFTFALGLGLLFLVLGTFSGLLDRLPKSGQWMNRIKAVFGVVLIFMAAFFAWPVIKPYVPSKTEVSEVNGLWKPLSPESLAEARKSGRPILIDFWAEWCTACHELEDNTFSDPDIQKRLQQMVLLKFDATRGSEEFEMWKAKFSIIGLPHIVFYDHKGTYKPKTTLTGFEKATPFAKRIDPLFEKTASASTPESQ